MAELTITFSDTDQKNLKNDLLDMTLGKVAMTGKITTFKTMQREVTKLMNDESFTDSIHLKSRRVKINKEWF